MYYPRSSRFPFTKNKNPRTFPRILRKFFCQISSPRNWHLTRYAFDVTLRRLPGFTGPVPPPLLIRPQRHKSVFAFYDCNYIISVIKFQYLTNIFFVNFLYDNLKPEIYSGYYRRRYNYSECYRKDRFVKLYLHKSRYH